MTSQHSNNRRQSRFIRWSTSARRQSKSDLPDPGFVIDRRQLYKYLDSLEGFSGE